MKRNVKMKGPCIYRAPIAHPEESPINIPASRNLCTEERAGFNKPAAQYAKYSSLNIAFQVFGSVPMVVVYIPGQVPDIDRMWSYLALIHFLQGQWKVAGMMLFDQRGIWLSDRLIELFTSETRTEDICTIMYAAGSQKAVLFEHSDSSCTQALFATNYPYFIS